MNFFGQRPQPADKKKEIKAVAKDSNRQISRDSRSIEKELRGIERSEKDLIVKIKNAHKRGQESDKKAYAKQLVQLRQTKDRLESTIRQLNGVKAQNTSLASSAIAAEAIGGAATAMAAVNQVVDPVSVQKTMNAFTTQMEKVNLKDEMWSDMMDEFDGEDVEAEADDVYNQVLDELGLEVGAAVPALQTKPTAPISTEVSDAELEEFLNSMPSSAAVGSERQTAA